MFFTLTSNTILSSNSSQKIFCLLLSDFELCLPPVWGPQPLSGSLGAKQLHGRYRVSEKVAEAEHGTDQHTRRTSAILRDTETHYYDWYKFTENMFYADLSEIYIFNTPNICKT